MLKGYNVATITNTSTQGAAKNHQDLMEKATVFYNISRKCQALVYTTTCSMIALLTSGIVVGSEHAGERKEAGSTSIKYFIMFLITVTGKFISAMYWRCLREGWLACGSHNQPLRVHCGAHPGNHY